MFNSFARSGPSLIFLICAALLPASASAQVIAVTRTPLSVETFTGQDAPSQTVTVRNAGGRAMKWSVVAPSASWLSVSPTRGTNTGTLGLTFPTSSLPAALYQTSFRVDSAAGSATVSVAVNAYSAPPAPVSTPSFGPQSTITCPAGAVDIRPGSSIQSIVNVHPGATTFCIRAGVHYLISSITPKTGNTFVGEYGAILDGTGWSTSDGTQAAFRAHNEDIDYVTIRNLVIRNMPQRGIHAYYWMADHWTIEYNEIASSGDTGIVFPADSVITNNDIHHNAFSGYIAQYAHNTTLDGNEIAYNGSEQRIIQSANVTFRNNFVHHNVGTGIYYDTNNTGALIEDNRVEDNGWIGIFYEISSDGIIRNNTIRRNAAGGVFLAVSKNVQIYNNTLEHNFRGITYYLNCPSVGGPTNFDLTNNTAHDNTITVGTESGAFASVFSYGSDCTSTQTAPYLNGSKNLTFSRNTYHVASPTTERYWIWGLLGNKYWYQWQSLGQDVDGVIAP